MSKPNKCQMSSLLEEYPCNEDADVSIDMITEDEDGKPKIDNYEFCQDCAVIFIQAVKEMYPNEIKDEDIEVTVEKEEGNVGNA